MARPPSTVSRLPAAAAITARTAIVMETRRNIRVARMGGMFGMLGMFVRVQRGIVFHGPSGLLAAP